MTDMLRLRRNLVPLLLMLPMIFVCGKLLLTPVNVVYGWPKGMCFGFGIPPPTMRDFDCGWPWNFGNFHEEFENAWCFPYWEPRQLSFGLLVANLAVLIAIIAASWFTIQRVARQPGGWFRFSLRRLLTFVALVSIVCGWWVSNWQQSKRERQIVEGFGEPVYAATAYRGPDWLRCFVAEDNLPVFDRVVALEISIDKNKPKSIALPNAVIQAIPQLRDLRALSFENGVQPSSSDLQNVPPFLRLAIPTKNQQIRSLKFAQGTADDETLTVLARLPELNSLKIAHPVSENGLIAIEQCTKLEKLSIDSPVWFDLDRFPNLSCLREVILDRINLSPNARDTLFKIKSIERLSLSATSLDDETARRLSELSNLKYLFLVTVEGISDEIETLLKSRIPEVEIAITF